MTILITGASQGIGAELALQLADSGHTLILLARNGQKLDTLCKEINKTAGKELAFALAYDVNELLVNPDDFLERFTGISMQLDILVNNAALLVKKPFEELTLEDSRRSFDANYFAPEQLIRICLPLLKQSGTASIINVTSMAAFQGSSKFPGLSVYGASKGALATLTECLAEEFKELNIRVNALAFGAVATEMLAEAFPGFQANTSASEMGAFFKWFVLEGWKRFNGKMLPVSDSTP